MKEEKMYLDADIMKLRQMYLEEKVNSNADYAFLENRISRLTKRSFLEGRFCMLCPECLEDITSRIVEKRNREKGDPPFSVLRTLHKSMMLALYETGESSVSGETVCDSFIRLFPTNKIEDKRSMETGGCLITWFGFKQTTMGRPFFHQIFSAVRDREMIVGHMHISMAESGRYCSLLERMLATIQL